MTRHERPAEGFAGFPSIDDDGNEILVDAPSLPREEIDARLAEIAGRPLTADEIATADRMFKRGRYLRNVVDRLFPAEAAAYFARAAQ